MKQINTYIIEKLHINKDTQVTNNKDPYDAKSYEVGDIICATYQYSSRHVHFFEIVGFNGTTTVEMVELGKKLVDGDWQNGSTIPDKEKKDTDIVKAKINRKGRLKYNDYFCYLWNGKPEDHYTD